MTYDTRKSLRGQEFVEEVEFILDACKYSVGDYWRTRELICAENFTFSQAGYMDVTGEADWNSVWAGYTGTLYMRHKSEVMEVEIDTDYPNEIVILTREFLPGEAGDISIGDKLYLMHEGEANGSCRGFPHTCSDSDSYDEDAKFHMKFCTAQRNSGYIGFGGLNHGSITHEAGEVDVGESIGTPARLRFTIKDQRHDDSYIVPYINRRSSSGTMFGKMLARHPYFVGREVVYRSGLRDSGSLSDPDWEERRFIIDDVSLSDDKFSVTALDPLNLTQDKKAKMPVASPAVLSAGIDTSLTAFSFTDAPDYYFGDMGDFVYVRIDSEVIYCEVTGATQLTPDTRGYKSENKSHDAGASIQDCVAFKGTNGIDAIEFALSNYTSIPASFIGDYSAVKALLPAFILDDCIISKPTPVIEFINAMIKIGDLIMGYDEILQQITIDYIPELSVESISINESEHIKQGSVKIDDNIKNQWTRFQHLWAPVDITKDTEENYSIRYMPINLTLESAQGLGQPNEKKPFKNMYLSGSTGDSLQAVSYADRVVSKTQDPPKIANFTIDAAFVGNFSGGNLKNGSIISLKTKESQDKDGLPFSELYQVLKISGNAYKGFGIKAQRYQKIEPDSVDFTITEGGVNYDLSDFYTPSAGNYVIYIAPTAIFGSYDTALPAFTTGTQAPGVSFYIIHRGQILGMGGVGGNCGIPAGPTPSSVQPGQDGGLAFEATVDCEIDCGSGLIWAGGGGASGAVPAGYTFGYFSAAVGGGGGQGYGDALSGYYTTGGQASFLGFSARGAPGNQSSPGVTGGGAWGENGATQSTALGGIAGEAIKSNGNTVTISAGDNTFNIRGRRT